MRRVRHSVVAFSTTAAAIMSVIAADLCVRPADRAEDWPTRPLTLVVPFSAGGSSDTIGRIIADGISSNLRQPVVVENVAGAGGMVGGSRVAKATPDGYQFVIGNVGTFAQSQWLYKAPLYNAETDFAPVALLTDESLVLVARNDFPADNLQQFIAYTKANQEKLHYSSSGAGGSNHLACMLLNSTIGIEVTHVPYRNVVQGLQEVMAGRMDYDCVSLPAGAAANWGQDRQANRDPEQDPVVEPAGSPLRARTGADQLRSPELVCTLPAREDSAADYPEAQPRHCRRARDAVLAAASQASRRRCDCTGTPLSGISRAISCRRNQEMGRPDQGEWRFILIAIDRMRFTYPCCPYPAHLARCAKRDIDELWLAPVWRQVGSFRMRRFVVYTEK